MVVSVTVTVGGGETNSVAIHQDDQNGNPVGGDVVVAPGGNATITVVGNAFYGLYEIVPNTIVNDPNVSLT